MRNEIYKKYRAMGYEASEALRLARLPKYDYGLNNLYDYMQVSETVNVPELAPEFEIKLECFYEDYAEVPWEFGESNGVVEHSGRYGNLGNGNVELWHGGHNQYHYRYGWQDAVRKVRKEFDEYRPKWGKTMRQDYALERVRSELKWFKGFCKDDWAYIWIKATLLWNGREVAEESFGGIESNDWQSSAEELVWQMIKESKAMVYAGSTVGCV